MTDRDPGRRVGSPSRRFPARCAARCATAPGGRNARCAYQSGGFPPRPRGRRGGRRDGGAVLRLHVVRGSGVDYYLTDLGPGRSDGSRVAGESPGVWTGGGAADLALGGAVAGPDLVRVLAGTEPAGERELRLTRGPRPVSGFDLVFTAAKSASVLHLLAHRELGAATGAAHDAAVADALDLPRGRRHRRRDARTGARSTTWPPPARWRRGSSTGRVGPGTPTSTPTWWWPTSPTASTVAGRRSTADACSSTGVPPGRCTTPRSGTTWVGRPASPGAALRTGRGRSWGSTPSCAASCRSARRPSTRRSHAGREGGDRPGPDGWPSTPTVRPRTRR